MHHLETCLELSLPTLMRFLVPNHNFRSVHDLFNPELFSDILNEIVIQTTVTRIHELITFAQFLKTGPSNQTYKANQERAFSLLVTILEKAMQIERIEQTISISKPEIKIMVNSLDLDLLERFLEPVFALMLRNSRIVEFITTLSQDRQTEIRDFIVGVEHRRQRSQLGVHDPSQYVTRIEELESILAQREQDLVALRSEKNACEEELIGCREMMLMRQDTIESLQRRLFSYQQADSLFQEKDDEIARLHKELLEKEYQAQVRIDGLGRQIDKINGKLRSSEDRYNELLSKHSRLQTSHQTLSSQRGDADEDKKVVISNLKNVIAQQRRKYAELQKELFEFKAQAEQKSRQIDEMSRQISILQQDTSELSISNNSNNRSLQLYSLIDDDFKGHKGSKQSFFEEEIGVLEKATQQLPLRVNQLQGQNRSLRERLYHLQKQNANVKQMQKSVNKLKMEKKVLQKHKTALQSQRNLEIDLLTSAMQLYVKMCQA